MTEFHSISQLIFIFLFLNSKPGQNTGILRITLRRLVLLLLFLNKQLIEWNYDVFLSKKIPAVTKCVHFDTPYYHFATYFTQKHPIRVRKLGLDHSLVVLFSSFIKILLPITFRSVIYSWYGTGGTLKIVA